MGDSTHWSYQTTTWSGQWENVYSVNNVKLYENSFEGASEVNTARANEVYYAFLLNVDKEKHPDQIYNLVLMRKYGDGAVDQTSIPGTNDFITAGYSLEWISQHIWDAGQYANNWSYGWGDPDLFIVASKGELDPNPSGGSSNPPSPPPPTLESTWTISFWDIATLWDGTLAWDKRYTATRYNYSDGSSTHSTFTIPANPRSVTGYTAKWPNSWTANTVVTINGNYNYQATYALIPYKITCHNNNGTPDTIINYTIESEDKYLGTPSKTGFDFSHWQATSNIGNWNTSTHYPGGMQISNMYGNNIILNAIYGERNYSIKFDGNGSTGGFMSDQEFNYSDVKELTANQYERKYINEYNYNYKSPTNQEEPSPARQDFIADNLTDSNENTWKWNGQNFKNKQKVTKLTTENNAVLTFKKQWTLATEKILTPSSRTGYTFSGWYANSSCTSLTPFTAGVNYTPDGTNHPSPNYTYKAYAKWIRNIGIFNLKKADADDWDEYPLYQIYELCWCKNKSWYTYNETPGSGVSITNIGTLPKRNGYKFKGFFDGATKIIDEDGNIVQENTYISTNNSIRNLIPQWEANTLTIKFKVPLTQIEWVSTKNENYYFDTSTGVLMYRPTSSPVTYTFTYNTKKKFHPQIITTSDKIVSIMGAHQFLGTNEDPSAPKHWKYGTDYFNEELEYSATEFITDIKNNNITITLTLSLEEIQYHIEYSTNGYEYDEDGDHERKSSLTVINSTGLIDSTFYKYSQNITLKTPTPVAGYGFAGWVLSSNISKMYKAGDKINGLSMVNRSSVTIYPVFTYNKVLLEFVDNKVAGVSTGDPGPTSITITQNQELTNITCPSRPGFIFRGYYIHPTKPYENPIPKKPSDEFIVSNWTDAGWKLVYLSNGGVSISTWTTPLPVIESGHTKYYVIAVWQKRSLLIETIPTLLDVNINSATSLATAKASMNLNTLFPIYKCTEAIVKRNNVVQTGTTISFTTTDLTIEEITATNRTIMINGGQVGDTIDLTFINKEPTPSDKQYYRNIRAILKKMENINDEASSQELSLNTVIIVLLVSILWALLLSVIYPLSIKKNFLQADGLSYKLSYTLDERLIATSGEDEFFYLPVPCSLDYITIYTDKGWQKAIPYIYTRNYGWELCRAFVSNSSKFKICGGNIS